MLYRVAQAFTSVEDQINVPKAYAGAARVQEILQIVFQVLGIVSVLIVVIAGLSYVLSGGDPQRTARAKDAILYAVIGLVISISAYGIVTYVLNGLFD